MLFKCPECGEKISSKAKVCIHCGCPVEYKNKNPILVNEIEYDFTELLSKVTDDCHVYYVTRLIMDETQLGWNSAEKLATIIKETGTLPHEFNGNIQETIGGP